MQECVSSDARFISLLRLTALRQNSCSSQQLPSPSSPPPTPPYPTTTVITLESLWLCTPFYYCQPIKTKASRIRRRIKLSTWEQDLREQTLSTASITPARTRTRRNHGGFVGHRLKTGPLLFCSSFLRGRRVSQPVNGAVSPRGRGEVTSAQYCCLASESMWANPPSTSAFIRDLCTELDSRWRGGLRLANCFARFHQLSHCTTMFALDGYAHRQTASSQTDL